MLFDSGEDRLGPFALRRSVIEAAEAGPQLTDHIGYSEFSQTLDSLVLKNQW
jgi:hypothetical protein